MPQESLEERLYNTYYHSFKRDSIKGGEMSSRMSYLGKRGEYFCGFYLAGLVCSGIFMSYKLSNDEHSNMPLKLLLPYGGFTVASAGLALHMRGMKEVFSIMHKKNIGGEITDEDIHKINKSGKIGRYAHVGATTAMACGLGALMSFFPPLLFAAPVLPLWAYTMYRSYGAMYSAAIDYVSGKRRQFKKN